MRRPTRADEEIAVAARAFKPYIVRRDHGQCQVLIPLCQLDDVIASALLAVGALRADRAGTYALAGVEVAGKSQ